MTKAITVLCIALTIALAVAGIWLWQAHERREVHIDWLMKRYRSVSYNCVAYDECTDSERWVMANCGKPTGVYRGPNPQADAAEDAANKDRDTKDLEKTRERLLDDRATGKSCISTEDIDGMIAGIDRELARRKNELKIVP
jgi:hypothetical protein